LSIFCSASDVGFSATRVVPLFVPGSLAPLAFGCFAFNSRPALDGAAGAAGSSAMPTRAQSASISARVPAARRSRFARSNRNAAMAGMVEPLGCLFKVGNIKFAWPTPDTFGQTSANSNQAKVKRIIRGRSHDATAAVLVNNTLLDSNTLGALSAVSSGRILTYQNNNPP
jgi:hypothetical protein